MKGVQVEGLFGHSVSEYLTGISVSASLAADPFKLPLKDSVITIFCNYFFFWGQFMHILHVMISFPFVFLFTILLGFYVHVIVYC